MNFLFVALGGAVGAMARYAISLIPLKTEFPFFDFNHQCNRCNSDWDLLSESQVAGMEYPKIWFCFGRPAYAVALPRFLHFHWKPIICLNIITACLDADMWC